MSTANDRDERPRSLRHLSAQIAASPLSGSRVVEAAEELSIEYERFNTWFYGRKGKVTTSELWHLSAMGNQVRDHVETAWNALLTTAAEEARDAERLALETVLRHGSAQLRQVVTTGVNTFRDPDIPEEVLD